MKYNRFVNQNMVDFVLTVYGDINESLYTFMNEVGYTHYDDFISNYTKNYELTVDTNDINTTYENSKIVISSEDEGKIVESEFICKTHLASKTTLSFGFSGDFNEDFGIDFQQGTVIAGYEGMDLYVYVEISNIGNKSDTTTGYFSCTGYDDIPYSVTIQPKTTKRIYAIFPNQIFGDKTVNVTGICTDELTINIRQRSGD